MLSLLRMRSRAGRATVFGAAIAILLLAHSWAPPASAKGIELPADVRLADTGEITVGYRVVGDGPPLVLIMGYSGVMDLWDPTFIEALARHHQVIMFDNRGMGYSTATEGPFTIPQFADDTAAFMDAIGIERASVLGWSMGSYVAQEFALRHPARLDRLVLYAGDCGGDDAIGPADSVLEEMQDTSGTDEERGLRLLRLLFPSTWIEANAAYLQQVFTRPMAPAPVTSVERQVGAMEQWAGTCDRLAALEGPTLVVTGDVDRMVPPENSGLLAALIPGATLVEFEFGGHGLMYQQPERLAAVVTEFLAR